MANNPGEGTIVDLEFAIGIDGLSLRADKKVEPIAHPTIGTPSFIAIDLHAPNEIRPVKHFFRLDLESFVYSLAWIVTHYHTGRAVWSAAFGDWMSGDDAQIAASKREFLASCAKNAQPFGVGVESDMTKEWLPRLCRLFADAFAARDAAALIGEDFNDETLGGRITYESFLIALEDVGSP